MFLVSGALYPWAALGRTVCAVAAFSIIVILLIVRVAGAIRSDVDQRHS